ncbi:CoA transferase [Planobispora longispora]|uniref:CoA transferase n=1 Tax=Planobispora longispora TaxID=28887 RepID=A0A8J3W387_9ACTN|nr:CoA transferase [Planobispora longispora]BFE78086.1 CoA transferase [Planobispora longispora]GIH73576.1 CoA transferase [Planobispora longispora]
MTSAWVSSGLAALSGRASGPPLDPGHRTAEAAAEWGDLLGVDGTVLLTERAALTGRTRGGRISVGGSCRLLDTHDGWVALSCARPDDPDLITALIGEPMSWDRLARWCRGRGAAEVSERARLLGLAAASVGEWSRPSAPPARVRVPDLRHVLVVDFSALWAGPLCAHLLGLAGARVVKVETPGRPDGARSGHRGFFDLLHAGHRSVVLEPHDPALHALVEAADVVIEASRPRALARWGLDAEVAAASGTVWLSITAYGRDHDRVGFGDDVAAAAGLVAWDGDTGEPLFCGDAIADPLTGLYAACRVVASLEASGGELLDVAMAAVAASTVSGRSPAKPVQHAPGPRSRVVPTAAGSGHGGNAG